jgi:succinate-acetate transporter protein
MATSQADMPPLSGSIGLPLGLALAKPRQFAFKTLLLATTTLALAPVVLWKSALATQVYLGALVVIHVVALVIFARGVQRKDIAPTRFGLFWRVVGLAVMVALLTMIRLVPDSPLFWPSLLGIWAVHTAGLSLLHLRAQEGAKCPFLPGTW